MKKRTKRFKLGLSKYIFFWLPVVIWALIIFRFSANPTIQASHINWKDFVIKKTAHIIEYAILSLLLYRGFVNSSMEKRRAGFWAIYLAIFYAISDEVHQNFTPGREPTLRDVFFDTIGAILAILFIWKYLPKAPKKLKDLASRLQIS